ncbi:acyl-CoA thioesterase [Petroclostridium sp. X23]|nr:acyl-CoA thioesterase [Petroclostridium sp. X23]WHH61590.1 acyl-CoA thioesterase [Petroclostridium sp. X23]
MLETKTELIVRYAETDKMGIAHHSNYAVWFEFARTEFFKKLGFSYLSIEEKGILLPLTDLKCSYKKPAGYEDEIIIKVRIIKMTCVRIAFSYEIYDHFSDLIAIGETAHAWTDQNLKPLNIEKKISDLYQLLKEAI